MRWIWYYAKITSIVIDIDYNSYNYIKVVTNITMCTFCNKYRLIKCIKRKRTCIDDNLYNQHNLISMMYTRSQTKCCVTTSNIHVSTQLINWFANKHQKYSVIILVLAQLVQSTIANNIGNLIYIKLSLHSIQLHWAMGRHWM